VSTVKLRGCRGTDVTGGIRRGGADRMRAVGRGRNVVLPDPLPSAVVVPTAVPSI
jgi:hypothetical protein